MEWVYAQVRHFPAAEGNFSDRCCYEPSDTTVSSTVDGDKELMITASKKYLYML